MCLISRTDKTFKTLMENTRSTGFWQSSVTSLWHTTLDQSHSTSKLRRPAHQSAAVRVIICLPPQNSKTKQTHKQCMIIRSLKTATDYHPRPPPPPSAPNCSPLPVLVCWKSVKLWMVYITHLHLPTTILTRFNSERALENCIDTSSLGSLY